MKNLVREWQGLNRAALLLFILSGFSLAKGALADDASSPAKKAAGAKTCVAFLLNEPKYEKEVKDELSVQLGKMGYDSIDPRFAFKTGGPKVLRECLEGDYEDVILVAHSQERVKGYQTLLYHPESAANPDDYVPLDGNVFKNIKVGPKLRQFTLVACEAEKVLENYKIIQKFTEKNKLNLKLQPEDIYSRKKAEEEKLKKYQESFLNRIKLKLGMGPKISVDLKIRDTRLLTYTLAESMQDSDGNDGGFYCLMRSGFTGKIESVQDSCLRNYQTVRATRMETGNELNPETYWVKVPTQIETASITRSNESPDKFPGLKAVPISEFDSFGVGRTADSGK